MTFSIKPENKDAPLNKYAWTGSSERMNVTPEMKEKDNQLEGLIRAQLVRYFMTNDPFPPESSNFLLDLLHKGMYSDVIKAPKTDVIYRGLYIIDDRDMLRFLLEDEFPTEDKSKTSYRSNPWKKLNRSFVYKPLNEKQTLCSSWSTDWNSAVNFCRGAYIGTSYYSLMLHARVSDNSNNLLACKDGLYKISKSISDSFSSREQEVLAIGNVNVYRVEVKLNAIDY
jgi:hypothetical protein